MVDKFVIQVMKVTGKICYVREVNVFGCKELFTYSDNDPQVFNGRTAFAYANQLKQFYPIVMVVAHGD